MHADFFRTRQVYASLRIIRPALLLTNVLLVYPSPLSDSAPKTLSALLRKCHLSCQPGGQLDRAFRTRAISCDDVCARLRSHLHIVPCTHQPCIVFNVVLFDRLGLALVACVRCLWQLRHR